MSLKKLDAGQTYLTLQGASGLFFALMTTTNLVYQVQVAHLSPLELVLVGTALELSVFLFEVPTGIVADVYSRRLSIIIGTFLIGAGFIIGGTIPRFDAILLSQLIWGFGFTFTSGATQAWIADEVGEAQAGHAFLRGAQFHQFGSLLGIAISTALANVTVNLPIIVGSVLYMLLALFLIVAMPEMGFKPTRSEDRNSWQKMAHTFQYGLQTVRTSPALLMIIAVGIIYSIFSEGFDRLWTPHFLNAFALPKLGSLEPVTWFGIVRGGGLILSIIATGIVNRRVDTSSHIAIARAMLVLNFSIGVGVMIFGLITEFTLGLLVLLAIWPLRTMYSPLYDTWVNLHAESSVRATVISMSSQAGALGEIIGGPIFGVIATFTTVSTALAAAGGVLLVGLVLYAREIRRNERE
jgi:DHA3 family tetracycline resistance protein-like MFS transporter